MAQRRMISKEIHQDGRFMTLSPTSKILYDDLVLYADDDGFCNDTDLINLMDRATDENYKELEKSGLLAKVEDHYLIVDWLTTQILNHYSRSSLLDLSSKVFIKLDFKYTVDPQNKNIAISLDDWIEKKNRDRKINLKALQQQRLKEVVTQKVPSGNPSVTQKVPKRSPSIGKYSIDKSSIEKVSTDQDQQRAVKATNYKYINSSSNGGMGEILLGQQLSTSTIDNNATKEIEEDSVQDNSSSLDNKEFANNDTPINDDDNTSSCLVDSNKQSNSQSGKQSTKQSTKQYQDNELQSKPNNAPSNDAKDLFNYLNTVFNIHIPSDERLSVLFEELSNQYQQQYIEQAIDQLADSLGSNNWDYRTVKNMVLSHLADTVKAVVKH